MPWPNEEDKGVTYYCVLWGGGVTSLPILRNTGKPNNYFFVSANPSCLYPKNHFYVSCD